MSVGVVHIRKVVIVLRWFSISLNGQLPTRVANKFWVEIARYDVNFMVLDRVSYIYGYAEDYVIDKVYEKAKELGLKLDIERG